MSFFSSLLSFSANPLYSPLMGWFESQVGEMRILRLRYLRGKEKLFLYWSQACQSQTSSHFWWSSIYSICHCQVQDNNKKDNNNKNDDIQDKNSWPWANVNKNNGRDEMQQSIKEKYKGHLLKKRRSNVGIFPKSGTPSPQCVCVCVCVSVDTIGRCAWVNLAKVVSRSNLRPTHLQVSLYHCLK